MIKVLRNLLIIYLCVFLYTYSAARVFADPALDETKELLKKSLTIVQLDQEIARLSTQDTQVTAQIDSTKVNLVKQDQQVSETREHAGKVLRAYYMGERESIWTLLFTAKSFADAIALYDYLSMIIANDHMLLNTYAASFNELKNLQNQLIQTQGQLREVKAAFIAQRDRNIALQKEVDARLKLIPKEQAQVILSKIDELKATFKDKVVPLFKKYFAGISRVMPDFVDHAIIKERDKYIVGTTFQVSDQDLTQFFREHDKLFENLSFQFQNGQYSVVGVDGDIKAAIKGHYTVEENPNRLQFHVDELSYNDNILDETTRRYMEEQFDLSLSVEKHTQGLLQAEEVTTENGLLTLKMKISLKPKES
jgi:peptidoglycan hydrolase CwlO-like protein